VYVWVDALTNYLSALGFGSSETSLESRYWPAQLHLVGKDIVRFHAVYGRPSCCRPACRCPSASTPRWWLRDEAKMSKSLGNVVRPGPLLDAVGPDALRYFLLREMTFGLDGTYSDEQLLDRYNGDWPTNWEL
jgi:methionyl-tRNA synthetase